MVKTLWLIGMMAVGCAPAATPVDDVSPELDDDILECCECLYACQMSTDAAREFATEIVEWADAMSITDLESWAITQCFDALSEGGIYQTMPECVPPQAECLTSCNGIIESTEPP